MSTATEKEYGQAGTSVIAAGWGSIRAIRFRTEPKYDSKPRHAQMEILDRDLCDLNSKQALYTEVGQLLEMNLVDKGVRDKVMETLSLESLWRTQLTSNMICSGILKKAVDVREGDSGGPLFVKRPRTAGRAEDTFVQVGVVSWVPIIRASKCGLGEEWGIYGVYVRVAQFTDWINTQTSP